MNSHQPSIQKNTFTGNPLDRAGNLRRQDNWIDRQANRADARFLPLWNLKAPIKHEVSGSHIIWVDKELAHNMINDPGELIFLGLAGEAPVFAFAAADCEDTAPTIPGNAQFEEVRSAAMIVPHEQASILAQARALVDWNKRHQFCSTCGYQTRPKEGGYARYCCNDQCKAPHFPRTDPVVIMLVYHGSRCLLGRQSRFPKGFFSTLAGFVEPGESIEEAVRREVLEEASIAVGRVDYCSSQPWPYPSSLMIGCIAEAVSTKITIDPHELSEAVWVDRSAVAEALDFATQLTGDPLAKTSPETTNANPEFMVPPPMAIAHQLMREWVGLSS